MIVDTAALLDALSQRIGTTPDEARSLFEEGVFRGQDAIDARNRALQVRLREEYLLEIR